MKVPIATSMLKISFIHNRNVHKDELIKSFEKVIENPNENDNKRKPDLHSDLKTKINGFLAPLIQEAQAKDKKIEEACNEFATKVSRILEDNNTQYARALIQDILEGSYTKFTSKELLVN